MEWTELTKYIDATVLLLIVILFARGVIVSRATMDRLTEANQKTLNEVKTSYEKTISKLCESFNKSSEDFKEVVEIMKKNGSK